MKGSTVGDEVDKSRELLAAVGVTSIDIVECGLGVLDEPTTVARLAVGTPQRLKKSGQKKAGKRKRSGPRSCS
jgi:16S rRNA (guanine527-N7)-methyltransferase